jgi:hypothetical protein
VSGQAVLSHPAQSDVVSNNLKLHIHDEAATNHSGVPIGCFLAWLCLAPSLGLHSHASPCLSFTPSQFPIFFFFLKRVLGCRRPEHSARRWFVGGLSPGVPLGSRNPHGSLCDKVAPPPFFMQVRTCLQAHAEIRHLHLVLLQVPGCPSFEKSGPRLHAWRRGSWGQNLQIVRSNLRGRCRSFDPWTRRQLLSAGRSPACGHAYRSRLVSRSFHTVREFWTLLAESEQ